MKSVYLKILLWCFATLAVSLLAFSMVSRFVEARAMAKGGPAARLDAMVLEEGVEAYESGGSPKLAAYLDKISAFLGQRYITDPEGRDLITGTDRSSLLNLVHSQWATPTPKDGHMIVALASADNRYRLITVLDPPFGRWTLVPYYLLIFAAAPWCVAALGVSIASPLRELARSVDRFGHGDLSVRFNSRRKDEIGDLARSFDRMAERIGLLLTAERRLLQDVSHELRSPLARMSFAAELMRRDDNREAAAAQIKSEIQRLSDLVGSLLQVTRSEGDPLARKEVEFSLSDLLSEIAADCKIEADARDCWLEVRAGSNPEMIGDRELLRRAFENIVRNAIHYSPPDSPIDISLMVNYDRASVSVRDRGPGVPEEFIRKLGQPFVRVDESRDPSTGGVGLGLAIAKRAIAIHQGSLSLENVQPGLKVSVQLPVQAGECQRKWRCNEKVKSPIRPASLSSSDPDYEKL